MIRYLLNSTFNKLSALCMRFITSVILPVVCRFEKNKAEVNELLTLLTLLFLFTFLPGAP